MFSARFFKFGALNATKLLLGVVLALSLAACGLTQKLRPYTIDIRQGNYVTQEMVSQLSLGMTEEQVRFIMGSPLLVDPFHADRWDYVYRLTTGGVVGETQRIALKFKDKKLSSVEGDVVAAPAQSAPRATP